MLLFFGDGGSVFLAELTLKFSVFFTVKFGRFFAQLKITDNSFYLMLVYNCGEPSIQIYIRFSRMYPEHRSVQHFGDQVVQHFGSHLKLLSSTWVYN